MFNRSSINLFFCISKFWCFFYHNLLFSITLISHSDRKQHISVKNFKFCGFTNQLHLIEWLYTQSHDKGLFYIYHWFYVSLWMLFCLTRTRSPGSSLEHLMLWSYCFFFFFWNILTPFYWLHQQICMPILIFSGVFECKHVMWRQHCLVFIHQTLYLWVAWGASHTSNRKGWSLSHSNNCSYRHVPVLVLVSCQLVLASVGIVPIIEIRVVLNHSHCPLHCGLYGVVHNFLTLEISHSSSIKLLSKLHPWSLRICLGRP